MKRLNWILVAALALGSFGSAAQAGWPSNAWHGYWADYHALKQWPVPYVYTDRTRVTAPFCLMEANGWRRQNLLGDHHFEQDSLSLTPAGKLKARWILTQAPPNHRTIFVQSADNQDATRSRIDAVQEWATHFLPDGQLPDVQGTHLIAEGRPADTVDRNMVKFRESSPAPQLPNATATGQ